MPVSIDSDESLGDAVMKRIRKEVELASHSPNQIDVMTGTQSGVWGLFGDIMIVSWQYSPQAEYREAANQDAMQLASRLAQITQTLGLPKNTRVRYALHRGIIASSASQLAAQWRILVAQAMIQLEMEHTSQKVESDQ